ncbi:MAG: phage shock protein PspC [Thermoleophilia bacterium]|nr:phage shock protein PspC [Thermoleophilia bacterium]
MKRVTIVNLAGTAFNLEDDGVAAVDAWLADARLRLAQDPDREEILHDFERAIAERCATFAPGDRDVVTGEQVTGILEALGTVEPASDLASSDVADGFPRPAASEADTPLRDRRLYRLTGDEAMLAGVCSGLAAYLRVDVTVVRVAAVVLTFVTSGALLIGYVIMAIVVPEADSPDKRAAVRGYGETAQEMMRRAREGAGPAFQSLGSLIRNAWKLIARGLHWIAMSIFWVVATIWALQLTWLFINGGGIESAFDPGTSTWLIALWVTCIAWLFAATALACTKIFGAASGDLQRTSRRARDITLGTVGSVLTVLAVLGTFAIPASASRQLSSLEDGSSRIELYGEDLCVTLGRDDDVFSSECRSGDHRVDID